MKGTVFPSSSICTTASTWILRICRSWAMRERSRLETEAAEVLGVMWSRPCGSTSGNGSLSFDSVAGRPAHFCRAKPFRAERPVKPTVDMLNRRVKHSPAVAAGADALCGDREQERRDGSTRTRKRQMQVTRRPPAQRAREPGG